uniref:Pentacotripeptide-repeat region of PRORP domain-containing protein n=1 Tax=Gossypium raimondii TaxID=29730 RepID=A0A0D2VA91_GOSRA|nr:hypothetical protein B456_013G071200 [Gossypium raimondii]
MTKLDFQHTLLTFSSVINQFCIEGNISQAVRLAGEMIETRKVPNINVYTTLIKGKHHYATVVYLCGKMEPRRLERDDVTFNIWIDAYYKLRRLDYGLSVWGKMMKLGFQPTLLTFSTMINGFCIEGKFSDAFRLVGEMIETGKVPNINIYTTLIKGFHIIGDIDRVVKLLKMLEERGNNPNVITYNIDIDSFYKKGLLTQGLTLLSQS